MTMLYIAAGCLVVAQIIGVYGLVTRKADLVFSIFMMSLVVASIVPRVGARQQLG